MTRYSHVGTTWAMVFAISDAAKHASPAFQATLLARQNQLLAGLLMLHRAAI